MADPLIPTPPGPFDFLFNPVILGQIISYIVLIGAILWREVIDPYKKRDWYKAYIITYRGPIDVIDVKPKENTFTYNNGTYFVGKTRLTRKYKIVVKRAGIYHEGYPHPLVVDEIKAHTKAKLKLDPHPEEITRAIEAKNMQALMTPKMPWKEMALYVILGACAGLGLGFVAYQSMFPCPVCPVS